MDNVPEQLGSLLLNEDGAVISSSGQLENDERSANVIMGILGLTSNLDPKAFPSTDPSFRKLSIVYDDHCYVVCLSNRRVHVVKKKSQHLESSEPIATA